MHAEPVIAKFHEGCGACGYRIMPQNERSHYQQCPLCKSLDWREQMPSTQGKAETKKRRK